jgi:multidrug efflux system membrane fusion protein
VAVAGYLTVEAAGKTTSTPAGKIIALAVVLLAIVLAGLAIRSNTEYPSTDDASIDADVVHVAATVGGRVIKIGATENATVRRGDLLFEIDPEPYRIAVQQVEASLATAQAELGTRGRTVRNLKEQTIAAREMAGRAATAYDLAARTVARLRPLEAKGYVSKQQLDDAETQANQAANAVAQAKTSQVVANTTVDTSAAAQATVTASAAALALARYNLRQTLVVAPQDGRVVGLTVATGEIVAPSQAIFTLVAADQWFVTAHFRETALRHIHVGDCVTAFSMLDRRRPLAGVVQGIGSGVGDADKIDLPRSVPYVERSLNWVRVAQRFPVRILLQAPPADLVRLGASAVVQVNGGPACRRA